MKKSIKRVVVTGGAGQIAYNLLFRIASGEMLGQDQPVILQILEIPAAINALRGVVMELEDCAFPLLQGIEVGSNAMEVFKDADFALLVGSKPRSGAMVRSDLLLANAPIFVEQGQALNAVASEDVKVLVVGNPCNTNCLIAMNNAPRIPRKNFHGMTRLDQNRALSQLAKKAEVPVADVKNLILWGNHSSTQVPDYSHVTIGGSPFSEKITDANWLENEFVPIVQERGVAIIKARGNSSAASAANAAINVIQSLVTPTPAGITFSTGVCSDGNPYGIEENLIFSFPCISKGDGNYEIVPNVAMDEKVKEKIKLSEKELLEERKCVEDLFQRV